MSSTKNRTESGPVRPQDVEALLDNPALVALIEQLKEKSRRRVETADEADLVKIQLELKVLSALMGRIRTEVRNMTREVA
mgnify:CR=1 FL=1